MPYKQKRIALGGVSRDRSSKIYCLSIKNSVKYVSYKDSKTVCAVLYNSIHYFIIYIKTHLFKAKYIIETADHSDLVDLIF